MKALMGMWSWPDGFWFRIFGYGINVHRRATHKVFYPERYGHTRWYYFGPICWRTLTRPTAERGF